MKNRCVLAVKVIQEYIYQLGCFNVLQNISTLEHMHSFEKMVAQSPAEILWGDFHYYWAPSYPRLSNATHGITGLLDSNIQNPDCMLSQSLLQPWVLYAPSLRQSSGIKLGWGETIPLSQSGVFMLQCFCFPAGGGNTMQCYDNAHLKDYTRPMFSVHHNIFIVDSTLV